MRTCIKAWMSLGQIPPLTLELAALERLKNRRHHFFSVAIDPILFKIAGNEDMHNILDGFEFRPDQTTDYLSIGKNSHRLIMGKTKSSLFLGCF